MPASKQTIRFCTSRDGARIAYATSGSGQALVKAANWLSHLEFDWSSPVWSHLLTELSRRNTLVRYDERGCGLSDWDVADLSFEAWNELERISTSPANAGRFMRIFNDIDVAALLPQVSCPTLVLIACATRGCRSPKAA